MGRKGNLAVFESSNISETGEATPTKIGVYAFDFNLYLHEFFQPILFESIFQRPWTIFLTTMDYSPWSEREIWPFLKVVISPKPEEPCPPKLMYMHLTSIPTCINFLSQFY